MHATEIPVLSVEQLTVLFDSLILHAKIAQCQHHKK